jgi:FSR family fosmidomycin resistance protein-like MFS transporter
LFAAFVIVPHGQASLAWFTLAALLAMALMVWTAGQHALIRRHIASMRASLRETPQIADIRVRPS